MTKKITIGIVSLQGDVEEHKNAVLASASQLADKPEVEIKEIKYPKDIEGVQALVFPGGESTTMRRWATGAGLNEPLLEKIKEGVPTLATCAGLIWLSERIFERPDSQMASHGLAALPIEVIRNAYGRQFESFQAEIPIKGVAEKFEAIFIRAPQIKSVADSAEVLAEHEGKPVAVRIGNVIGTTFHPELSNDTGFYKWFLGLIQ